jgi:hypothetical protein
VGLRFNPPPNWPPPPPGFVPPPRWQPDPAWPPPPPGWRLWVPDDTVAAGPEGRPGRHASPRDFAGGPGDFAAGSGEFTAGSGDFVVGSRDFADGSGEFPAGPGEFATDPRDWPREFPGGPRAFVAGPGEFGNGAGGFAGPGEFAGGPDDFAEEPGDFADAGPIDPFGPPAEPYPDGLGGPPGGPGSHGPLRGRPNGLAIAAFVLSAIGGTVVSFVLALLALRQIRRTEQPGRGLAIAALVLSLVWALVLGFYFLGRSPAAPPKQTASGNPAPSSGLAPSAGPSSGSSPGSGSGGTGGGSKTGVFALRTGQCFQNPSASLEILGITSVAAVPCTTPHDAQVFAEFPATGNKYPGRNDLKTQAGQGCRARISKSVTSSKITSSMTLRFLYPLTDSWSEGHRTITCLIVDAKPDLTSSLMRANPKH